MNDDSVSLWLAESRKVAEAGSRAETALELIDHLYASLIEVSNCHRCITCATLTEEMLVEAEDIVEDL